MAYIMAVYRLSTKVFDNFTRLGLLSCKRNFGTSQSDWSTRVPSLDIEDKVVISNDGSTIICWHPEKTFPYELSRPLPEIKEEESIFKVQKDDSLRHISSQKPVEFVRQELMKITHTTKHRWFPRSRDKYFKKKKHDREYL